MKNIAFSAHFSLQLAKHHRATLNTIKLKRKLIMKMAIKFCEDHIPKFLHANFPLLINEWPLTRFANFTEPP